MLKAPMFFIVFLGSRTGADRSERGGSPPLSTRQIKSKWRAARGAERSSLGAQRADLDHDTVLNFNRISFAISNPMPRYSFSPASDE